MNFTQLTNGMSEGFVLLKKCEEKRTKTGSCYLDVVICDKDGEMTGKWWDYTPNDVFSADMIVKIRGTVEQYNGKDQFRISQMRPANSGDSYNLSDLVPSAEVGGEQLFGMLRSRVDAFDDAELKAIVLKIIDEKRDKLVVYPAALRLHHAIVGGLMYHTMSIVRMAEEICKIYPNINKERILMLPNGIDLSRFAHKTDVRSRVRQQLGLTTQMVIGHVGRFAYQKNHTFLLEVFAALCAQRPDVRLLLVGQGDLQEAMQTKAQTLGIEDRVIFYGVTDQPEDLFQAMDLFALPSHFEGLPIVGVEAQAAGLPCLFSSCITRQVKINPNVDFLPIDKTDSPALWAQKMTEMMGQREADATRNLTQAGFAIQNTVETIWKIYAN